MQGTVQLSTPILSMDQKKFHMEHKLFSSPVLITQICGFLPFFPIIC